VPPMGYAAAFFCKMIDDADLHETSSSSAWRVRVASANAYSGGLSSLEKRYL